MVSQLNWSNSPLQPIIPGHDITHVSSEQTALLEAQQRRNHVAELNMRGLNADRDMTTKSFVTKDTGWESNYTV